MLSDFRTKTSKPKSLEKTKEVCNAIPKEQKQTNKKVRELPGSTPQTHPKECMFLSSAL